MHMLGLGQCFLVGPNKIAYSSFDRKCLKLEHIAGIQGAVAVAVAESVKKSFVIIMILALKQILSSVKLLNLAGKQSELT